jgi:uncharacterized paraquat-inducible protein A
MAFLHRGIAVLTLQPHKIRAENRRAKRLPAAESTEWAGAWSLLLGLVAMVMAAIVYVAGRDAIGASFILFGTAVFVALMMRASARPQD